jgi:hypothetical protein
MKKLSIFVSCFAAVLILSKVSFAQSDEVADPAPLSTESIIAEPTPAVPQTLPFGYPPYPTVGGYPAYGIPYSYPRAPRRLGARFSPPPYRSHPLPAPGVQPMVAPPMTMGQVPPLQGTIGTLPPSASQGSPTVFYRPTPVRNFMMLMTAPRPYIGYDPYAGYPPFPGYVPPQ